MSSRHADVSCDSCLKSNFHGHRYKCLKCYNYDLCATCYENGLTTACHLSSHSMQCIITERDCELYYGGKGFTIEQPQSFSCPYCSKIGFDEYTLQEHVASDHSIFSSAVICPICAALPEGYSSHLMDDLLSHLTQEHNELREFQEEPMIVPQLLERKTVHLDGSASRMHLIEEFLSQLSIARRQKSRFQQLETNMQKLKGISKQLAESVKPVANTSQANTILDLHSDIQPAIFLNNSPYLLDGLEDIEATEFKKQIFEVESADQSLFVQEVLLSTLSENILL